MLCWMYDQWVWMIFHSSPIKRYTSVVFQNEVLLNSPSGFLLNE